MSRTLDVNKKAKSKLSDIFKMDTLPILLVFIAYVIVIYLINPRFLMWLNVRNVLIQVSITGILAIGTMLVMTSGGIDLSIGTMVSFIGCGMAYLMAVKEMPIWQVVGLALLVAVVFQLIMGFIISRLEIEPFIVSLGFMSIYQGFTYLITRGSEIAIGDKFKLLGKTYVMDIGMPVYMFLGLVVIIWLVLKYTVFGRRLYAVGGNNEAAYLVGIDVKNFKLSIYLINGLLVAFAAMILTSRIASGNPNMGSGKEIEAIAAAVVGGTAMKGGKSNIWGVVIGVLLLGSISNSMNILGVSSYWQYSFRGIIIVIAVILSHFATKKSS